MQDRLNYLESHCYQEEPPFYADDLKRLLAEIYYPKNVADISDMDNGLSYEYLVALDNKGFLSESVDLGNGIFMETMDRAIEERDLHYLYVQVSAEKPFLIRNIWKYLKGSNDLEVFEDALTNEHKKVFENLFLLTEKYGLIYLTEEDLKIVSAKNDEKISFYKKYNKTQQKKEGGNRTAR